MLLCKEEIFNSSLQKITLLIAKLSLLNQMSNTVQYDLKAATN